MIEHGDRRGTRRRRRDGDGFGAGRGERLDQRLHQCARGRRDGHHHAVRTGNDRRAPSEGGIVRGPGRQAIDLRAHHAVEKFGRALRQFERLEQHARRPQHQFGAAAAQHRGDAFGVRADELPLDQPHALEWQAGRRAASGLNEERAAVLLDDLHGLARAEARQRRDDRARGGVEPARHVGGDVGQAGHRALASSMSSRQVRTR